MTEYEMTVRVLRRRWAQVLRLAEMNNDRTLIDRSGFYAGAIVSLEDVRHLRRRNPEVEELEQSVAETRQQLARAIDQAEYGRRVVLHKHGRRVAAVISWRELLELRAEKPYCERERNAARAQQSAVS